LHRGKSQTRQGLVLDLGRDGANAPAGVYPKGTDARLAEALERQACLSEVNDGLIQLLAGSATDPFRALIDDDGPIAGYHVFDPLRQFPSARPTATQFVKALTELKPRLYSISMPGLRKGPTSSSAATPRGWLPTSTEPSARSSARRGR
jgi:hypothetical protein